MPANRHQRAKRFAIAGSIGAHVLVAFALLYYRPWQPAAAVQPPAPKTPADQSESNGSESGGLNEKTAPESVTGKAVEDRLATVLNEARQRPHDQNLERLEGLILRLEGLADDDSLDDLGGRLQEWLQTDSQRSVPQAAVTFDPDAFDSESALIETVRRERAEDGSWLYVARMVDAQGVASDIEMDPDPGRRAYDTFRLIDSSPLTRKIYQNFAMPLIERQLRNAPAGGPEKAGTDSPAEEEDSNP